MKKTFLFVTLFIFVMGCLMATSNSSTINGFKPMSEKILSPISTNTQPSIPTVPNRQNYLNVDFTGLTTLPAGWTIDAQAAHWSIQQTNLGGGTSPELRFDWSPAFTGISRFISPVVDLTGVSLIDLEFMSALDHYTSPYTIGVATRSNGGAWTDVWTLAATESVAPALIELAISNADVGSSTFQVCFYFSGYSYNINDWYIDNIRLFSPWPNDVKVKSIDTNITYVAGQPFVPPVVIANVGTISETFPVTCEIKEFETVVYTQTITMTVSHGAVANAPFPPFTPATVNEIYQITVTTNLVGDQDTTNDSKTKSFNTFACERQKVMVEIGTGTWCQYCPGAAMGADDLVTNGKDVAVVEYHNGDTFTNDASNARNTYYNITGFPTAFFDGTNSFVGGSHTLSNYQYYLPMYEAAIPLMSPFYIALTGTFDGSLLNVNATIDRFARISTDPLVLHFAITESAIQIAWQGQTHLEFVERAMLPDFNGSVIDVDEDLTQTIPLTATINSAWNVPNLDLVAFIQNPATKVIYAGFVMPLINLAEGYTAYPPQTLSAVHNGSHVDLSWTFPAVSNGLSGYLIYRDDTLIYTMTRLGTNQYSDVAIPGEHTYLIKALFGPSVSVASNTASVTVGNNDPVAVPGAHLMGSYPNPFSQNTSIRYEMMKDAKVSLAVYNVKGQLVRTLESGLKAAGNHEIVWDGKDNHGNQMASGIYIYQFNTGNVKQTQKAILLK
jgi:hypothetical protein